MVDVKWLSAVNTSDFTMYALAENAISVEFGSAIDDATFNRIQSLNEAVHKHPFDGFQCTVPAYNSLTIFFDPMRVMATSQLTGINCFEKVSNLLWQLGQTTGNTPSEKRQAIRIAVCYDELFGPDLSYLAQYYGMTKQQIIDLHSAATYKVHMIGFIPGFAYLGGMSEQLAAPRKKTPRNKVPAGSVGIAGAQTGIYPFESPGGWQLIGRTPLQLFNSQEQAHPSLLRAGDEVIFHPISASEFHSIQKSHHAHQTD